MPQPQPTVLLRHAMEAGTHYDWLIARPGEDLLWTARVADPSSRWAELGRWTLEALAPHRRVYLTYEGPVSGDRGTVERVDSGEVRIEAWTADAATLVVAMTHFQGRVSLVRQAERCWTAEVC